MLACKTLPLTSSVAGSGPRKTPTNVSLLHSVIALITKEMEQISRNHSLQRLELAFDILHHNCDILECRVIISKVSQTFKCFIEQSINQVLSSLE